MSIADIFEAGSPIPAYLEEVTAIHGEVLGRDLIALYLHGSAIQADFHPGSSDLDILGVVAGAIEPEHREELTARLVHEALPVPAFGLELILCTQEAVRSPMEAMPFEFALSTGEEWGSQIETDGITSDTLIHMQLSRQAGFALVGAPASDILSRVPARDFRAALLGEMLWHRDDLRGDPTDQAIVNAALNTARSLYAAETGEIVSKTEGGKWWLAQRPSDGVVARALEYRNEQSGSPPTLQSVRNFVELAIAQL